MSAKKKLISPEKKLFDISKTEDERLLTKQEIATFLHVSVKMIDKKVSLHEIPFIKVGRLVRFSKQRVMEAMIQGTPSR